MTAPATITVDELAAVLGVSSWSIYQSVLRGDCPVPPFGSGVGSSLPGRPWTACPAARCVVTATDLSIIGASPFIITVLVKAILLTQTGRTSSIPTAADRCLPLDVARCRTALTRNSCGVLPGWGSRSWGGSNPARQPACLLAAARPAVVVARLVSARGQSQAVE